MILKQNNFDGMDMFRKWKIAKRSYEMASTRKKKTR
jgi:hypothetical protein